MIYLDLGQLQQLALNGVITQQLRFLYLADEYPFIALVNDA